MIKDSLSWVVAR